MDITTIVRMDRPRRPCRFALRIEIDSTEASGLEHLIRLMTSCMQVGLNKNESAEGTR